MKKIYSITICAIIILSLVLISSCTKLTYADLTSAQDAVNVGFHMNAVIEDAANVVSGSAALSGSTSATDTVAGGTVSIDSVNGTVSIVYDGTTTVDGKFIRSGSMTIQLANYPATHWIDQLAQINIYLHHLKFTNVASGHSYTYEGPNTLINNTGGLAYQMLAGLPAATNLGAIQYKLTSSADTITFYDAAVRVWNFNRIRTYTNTGGNAQVGVSSAFSTNGYTNVDMWCTDRIGNPFYESIIQSLTFNTLNCNDNYRDARTGEAKVYEQQFAIDMGFGAVSATSGSVAFNCPYGFKTTYVNSRSNYVEAESPYWY